MASKTRKPNVSEPKKAPSKPTASKPPVKKVINSKPQPVALTKSVKTTSLANNKKKIKVEIPIQNFTVASPPSQRKHEPESAAVVSRERKLTRTLNPGESFLENMKLIQNSRQLNLDVGPKDVNNATATTEIKAPIMISKPISYEIMLDKRKVSPEKISPPDEYEDDFESYESDFEECESSSNSSMELTETIQNDEDDDQDLVSSVVSSLTQPEISLQQSHHSAVLGKSKIKEDSSSSISELKPPIFKISSDDRSERFPSRGQIILSKISLDDLTYSLLELQPMKYDHLMGTFGLSKSLQVHCQTDSFSIDKSVETDICATSTKWTQGPHVGEDVDEQVVVISGNCFDSSLAFWERSRSKYSSTGLDRESKPSQHQQLGKFLKKSFYVISQMQSGKDLFVKPSALPMSQGQSTLPTKDYDCLKNLCLTKLFVNTDTLITVHNSKTTVSQNLICLWSVASCNQLACCVSWGQVSCLDLPSMHVLIAGTKDGSLAVWDPLGHEVTASEAHVLPSQIIRLSNDFLCKYGAIRSIKCSTTPRLKVYCLHEENFLTTWITLKTSNDIQTNNLATCDLSYASPFYGSRLTNIASAQLTKDEENPIVGKSKFSKVLHCFDNDILQDSVLQKLIGTEVREFEGQNRFMVTDLLLSGKSLSLVTNQNFMFHGVKKKKLWLTKDKSDAVTSYSLGNGQLTVTCTGGLIKLVKFPATTALAGKRYRNGEVMAEELANEAVELSRKTGKTLAQNDGKHFFNVSGQELKYYAGDMKTAQTLKNCSVKEIEVMNGNDDHLILLLMNGEVEVHKLIKTEIS